MLLNAGLRRLEFWHGAWLGTDSMLAWRDARANNTRAGFDGCHVQLPAPFGETESLPVARAAIAHIAAHKMFGGGRFAVGSLKPIQIALVSLIEDARVEALALRARPGLRVLWAPFYQSIETRSDLAGLLARLAFALFDLNRADPHPWIEKGRRLFVERVLGSHDAAASRVVGGLLGNDLGQMRLQFNWKSYVVEPAYRDDNSGLWDFEAAPEDETTELDALAPAQTGDERGPPPPRTGDDTVRAGVRGENAGAMLEVPAQRKLPEWDFRPACYRQDWVSLREEMAALGDGAKLASGLREHDARIAQLSRLLRAVRVQQLRRRRALPDGDDLDIDACVAAQIDRRAGQNFNARVYAALQQPRRELALSLLLDASQSTAAIVEHGCVLDLERGAAVLLARALVATGDGFSVAAFRSCGREDVRISVVKNFSERWSETCLDRLAGLHPGFSTRLGAALRDAGRRLSEQPAQRRLLFVLTDGEPSDIDCPDPRYLREDARQAVRELRRAGVDVFCIGLDPAATADLEFVFGRGRAVLVPRLADLGERLCGLYFKLAR